MKHASTKVAYDSEEEKSFMWYLDELAANGYIFNYEYQPVPFALSGKSTYFYHKPLKTKTKEVLQTLLAEHKYTADFRIDWAGKARGVFFNNLEDLVNLKKIPFVAQGAISYIEIKPAFDVYNMQREFTINQKWVWQQYGIYIQKVIISNKKQKFFAKTFTPVKYLRTPTGKEKKLHYSPVTLEQFVKAEKETI